MIVLMDLGVVAVDVNQEKNLVSITGEVDHVQVIKMIKKKMDRKAELVEEKEKVDESTQKVDDKKNNVTNKDDNKSTSTPPPPPPPPQIQTLENGYLAYEVGFLEDVWGGRHDQVPPCYNSRMMINARGYAGDLPPPPPPPSPPPPLSLGDYFFGPRPMPPPEGYITYLPQQSLPPPPPYGYYYY